MSIKKDFKVRKIVKPLYLENYYLDSESEPSEEGDCLHVWVNISKRIQDGLTKCMVDAVQLAAKKKVIINKLSLLDVKENKREIKNKRADLVKISQEETEISDNVFGFYSEIWSQHVSEEEHISPKDVKVLSESLEDQDPGLWNWLCRETSQMVRDHREGNLKN